MKLHALIRALLLGQALTWMTSSGATVYLAPRVQSQPAGSVAVSAAEAALRDGFRALQEKRLDAAEKAFLKARKLDPGTIPPLLGLADVALNKKHYAAVAKWLAEAERVEPGSAEIKLAWGRFQRRTGDHREAEISLRQSIARNASVSAWLELSSLYLADLKKTDAAIDAGRKAVALAPDNAITHYTLGMSLAAAGKVDLAMREFETTGKLEPTDPAPWHAIARLHAEKHRFADAARNLDRALQLQPNNPVLLADRGDIAMAQNQAADAGRLFQKAVQQLPDSAALRSKLGLIHQLGGKKAAAEAEYLKAIKLNPDLADVYNNLAWLVSDTPSRRAQAVKWAEKANALAPDNPVYLDTLGWLHHLAGSDARALPLLRRASTMTPALPDAHYHLGNLLEARGNRAEAAAAYQRALEINPAFAYADAARKRLAAIK